MAKPIAVSGSYRNGVRGDHSGWSAVVPSGAGEHALADQGSSNEDSWPGLHPPSDPGLEPLTAPSDPDLGDPSHLDQLRQENARLRSSLTEVEQLLDESVQAPGGSKVGERLKELEALLEEKSEVIRELHRRLNEHSDRPAAATPREEELLALSEELERERGQLKEDEAALMQQMRDMEVQMSRERAEIARQRNEVQRLQSEIRHELELAGRDSALRERLAPLQRRHQELLNRRGTAPSPTQQQAAPAPQPVAQQDPGPRKDSSLFRRLFGQK